MSATPLAAAASVAHDRVGAQAPTVALETITLEPVSKGGYRVAYRLKGTIPKQGLQVLLALGSSSSTMDVSGRPEGSVIDASNLGDLLGLIERQNAWARELDCRIVLRHAGRTLAVSRPEPLKCPVPPLSARLTLATVKAERPALTYPGNGHGRLLREIGGRQYFVHHSRLETSMAMRGFDCTTFPMALFDCHVNMSGKYGTALAQALGARRCGMEGKKEADLKAFFAKDGATGTYMMWSAKHVVLVKKAVVHEFTFGGYRRSDAGAWGGYRRAPMGQWWVRKLLQPC